MKAGKLVLGALAGLASGALAGILFAPDKGSKTRKQITDKANDYGDGLKSKYTELRDSLTKKFNSTKKDAEKLVDKGKAKYYDAEKDAEVADATFKSPSGNVSY